jgi:hypothetical protein
MEYNQATGVNYKLFARRGYKADILDLYEPLADGGVGVAYSIAIEGLTKKGQAFSIDWTSEATAVPAVTALWNAWSFSILSGTVDTDCVAQGDCTITLDDGAGHSGFVLSLSASTASQSGASIEALGFNFAKGTSDLVELYIVNPAGK